MGKEGVVAELEVLLGADTSDYEKKFDKIWKQADKNLDKFKEFGQGMSLYVTAPLLAAASAAVVWAAEEETADARTAAALRNVGVNYDKVSGRIHNYTSALEALSGFADTDLQNTFTSLVTMTGSASTSMQFLSVATDLAAATTGNLDQATMAIGRALNGEETALKRMGIAVSDNLSPLGLLAELQARVGGTAEKVAATVEGKWNKIKNAFQNVAEAVGHSLEPMVKSIEDAVLKAISYGQKLANFFAQQPESIKRVIVAVLALVAAIGPLIVVFATLASGVIAVGTAVAAAGGWAVITGTLSAIAAAAWAAVAPFIVWPAMILAVVATFAIFYSNGQKIAAGLTSLFFSLVQFVTQAIGGLIESLGKLFSYIPGIGDKMSVAMREAAGYVKGFSTGAGEAANQLSNDYTAAGGYIANTTQFLKDTFLQLATAIGINMETAKAAIAGLKAPVDGLGPPLDASAKAWKAWAESLKVTVQDLATGIYRAFAGAVQGSLDVLTSGSKDWKGVLLNFLKQSLAATTAWAIAKMTIFENVSKALAATLAGPFGWLVIGGLIAATIAVGNSVPAMATGGMTSGPMLAQVGDNPSGKEVVMPLDSPQTTNALAKAMPAGAGGDQTIIFQIGDEEVARLAVRGMPSILRITGVTNGS